MWWIVIGIVAVWGVMSAVVAVTAGRAIRTADIEDAPRVLREDISLDRTPFTDH